MTRDRYPDVGAAMRQANKRAVAQTISNGEHRVLNAVFVLVSSWSRLTDHLYVADVAASAGLGDRHTRACLKKLAVRGIITWEPRRGRNVKSRLGIPPCESANGNNRHSLNEKPAQASAEDREETTRGRNTSYSSLAGERIENRHNPVADALADEFGVPHTKTEKKCHTEVGRELLEAVAEEFGDVNGSVQKMCADEIHLRWSACPWSTDAKKRATPRALTENWALFGEMARPMAKRRRRLRQMEQAAARSREIQEGTR